MIVRDAINYAHDLVVKCGKLDLPHKMEAHAAIDRIEAAHKREIIVERNLGTDEIDMAVAAKDATIALHEKARLEAENAKMREVLDKASDTMRLVIESAEDVMQPHLVQEICHCGLAIEKALASEGGAK